MGDIFHSNLLQSPSENSGHQCSVEFSAWQTHQSRRPILLIGPDLQHYRNHNYSVFLSSVSSQQMTELS